MNLKETLKNAINYQLIFGLDEIDNKIERAADNCEKIADDYAIEFAQWLETDWTCDERWTIIVDEKELLEIFKKEKGL